MMLTGNNNVVVVTPVSNFARPALWGRKAMTALMEALLYGLGGAEARNQNGFVFQSRILTNQLSHQETKISSLFVDDSGWPTS
jgi:hypothetical protein